MKAFFLAGGLGTRLGSLTSDLPKVMVEIDGRPVLEYLIYLCLSHKINEFVFSLSYLPEKVQQYFGDGRNLGAKIEYSIETEPRGTAGAIRFAEKFLRSGPFLVFNADVLTDVNLTSMIDFHRKKGGSMTVLARDSDHPFDSDLVEFNGDFLITRFFRPKVGDPFRLISKSGTHIIEPNLIDYIPESGAYSLEKELIPNLLTNKEKIYAYYDPKVYSKDMGTPERLEEVRRDWINGKIHINLPARQSSV